MTTHSIPTEYFSVSVNYSSKEDFHSPVPGGPYNSTPLGAVIPMLLNNSDLVMGNTTTKIDERKRRWDDENYRENSWHWYELLVSLLIHIYSNALFPWVRKPCKPKNIIYIYWNRDHGDREGTCFDEFLNLFVQPTNVCIIFRRFLINFHSFDT